MERNKLILVLTTVFLVSCVAILWLFTLFQSFDLARFWINLFTYRSFRGEGSALLMAAGMSLLFVLPIFKFSDRPLRAYLTGLGWGAVVGLFPMIWGGYAIFMIPFTVPLLSILGLILMFLFRALRASTTYVIILILTFLLIGIGVGSWWSVYQYYLHL